MSSTKGLEFPRINFVAPIAAALFLTSVFLEWWGISTSGLITEAFSWSLWGGPSRVYINSGSQVQPLVSYSPIVGALVTISAILILLGILPRLSKLMIGSAILAIAAPVLYVILVNETVSNACQGATSCISGSFGTQTFGAGTFSLTVNWGFQIGFYVEIVGAVISILAIAFQRTYLTAART